MSHRTQPSAFALSLLLGIGIGWGLPLAQGPHAPFALANVGETLEVQWSKWSEERDAYARALAHFQSELEDYELRMSRLEAMKAEALLLGRGLAGLRSELSSAHAAGVRLTEMDNALRDQRTELEDLRQSIVTRIASLLERHDLAADERSRWTQRLERVDRPVQPPSRFSVEALLAAPMYTPEQVRAALDELRDLEAAVQRSLRSLDEEVRRARLRDRLEEQRAGWAWEEAHLESGERRGRSRRAAGGPDMGAASEDDSGLRGNDAPSVESSPPPSTGDQAAAPPGGVESADSTGGFGSPAEPPLAPVEPPLSAVHPEVESGMTRSDPGLRAVDMRRAAEGVRAPPGGARTARSRTSQLEAERSALEVELQRIQREQVRLQSLGRQLEQGGRE